MFYKIQYRSTAYFILFSSQNGFEKPGTSASELPKEPEKPEDQPSSSKSVDFLHERKNIFDNDEFDVFASGSSIDKSRIHYGKKDKGKIDHWTSGTEEDVGKLRQLYNRYGLGAEDTDNDDMLLRGSQTYLDKISSLVFAKTLRLKRLKRS